MCSLPLITSRTPRCLPRPTESGVVALHVRARCFVSAAAKGSSPRRTAQRTSRARASPWTAEWPSVHDGRSRPFGFNFIQPRPTGLPTVTKTSHVSKKCWRGSPAVCNVLIFIQSRKRLGWGSKHHTLNSADFEISPKCTNQVSGGFGCRRADTTAAIQRWE